MNIKYLMMLRNNCWFGGYVGKRSPFLKCYEINDGCDLLQGNWWGTTDKRCRGNKTAEWTTAEARWWEDGGTFSPLWYAEKKEKERLLLVYPPQMTTSALPGFQFMNDCASFSIHLKGSLRAQSYTPSAVSLSIDQHFLYFLLAFFCTYVVA